MSNVCRNNDQIIQFLGDILLLYMFWLNETTNLQKPDDLKNDQKV